VPTILPINESPTTGCHTPPIGVAAFCRSTVTLSAGMGVVTYVFAISVIIFLASLDLVWDTA